MELLMNVGTHDIRMAQSICHLPFSARWLFCLAALAGLGTPAYSQVQRSFINLSFEDPLVGCTLPSGTGAYQVASSVVPGWETTHSVRSGGACTNINGQLIELWKDGFQSFNAHDGSWFAELNADEPSNLYQTVCLFPGDIVTWRFAHRARVSGGAGGKDGMAFEISDALDDKTVWENPRLIVEVTTPGTSTPSNHGQVEACGTEGSGLASVTCNAVLVENNWTVYSGSFVWEGEAALRRFGFVAKETASANRSVGNFLDSISLEGITPIVQFSKDYHEELEGVDTEANFPIQLLVSGKPEVPLQVDVVVEPITADANDLTTTTLTITVPPGNYAGTAFQIPLGILPDGVQENREQFALRLIDKPGEGGYRVFSTEVCGAPGIATATYTILDAHIALQKIGTFVDVAGGIAPDGSPIKNAGDRMDYEFIVTNTGDIALTDLIVTDTIIGTPTLDPSRSTLEADGTLPPGGVAVFVASYTLTQEDVDSGIKENVATATASIVGYPDQPQLTASSDHTEPIPHIPSISMVKEGRFDPETDDGDGLPDPGERLRFDITVTNDGNITAFDVYPEDPGPTFDGQPGTGVMSPFTPGPSTILPGESVVFTAFYTLSTEDIAYGSGLEDSVKNQASVNATDPTGAPLKGEMPSPMALTMPGFGVEKQALITQTQRGGRVPYVLILKPMELIKRSPIRLVDIMPAGFVYIPGTATVDGVPHEPVVEGRRLSWELEVDPGKDVEVQLTLGVSASAPFGEFTNTAQAERIDNDVVYRRKGQATVEIIPEPVFDCGDIIGKVFDDRNRNGYHDEGEPGVAGARVVSLEGVQTTTDAHGRFHVACADLPGSRIGKTYMMKLDPRSLPSGYRIISENPRAVRLTAGKTTDVSFATALTRVVRLDITGSAFEQGSEQLMTQWQERIIALIATLEAEPSVLRIVYRAQGDEGALARNRLRQLRRIVQEQWRTSPNRYRLEIETSLMNGGPAMTSGG